VVFDILPRRERDGDRVAGSSSAHSRARWAAAITVVAAFLLPLLAFPARSAPAPSAPRPSLVKTLSVEVLRRWKPVRGEPESLRAHVYYSSTGPTLVDVRSPRRQIIQLADEHQRILYPETGEAFDFIWGSKQFLPFVQNLTQAMDNDNGLSAAGFTLEGSRSAGDTLISWWNPPLPLRGKLGQTRMATVRGRLAWVEIQDAKGQIMVRRFCTGTLQAGPFKLPARIRTEVRRGSTPGVEVVEYSSAEVNRPLPSWVTTFQLPRGAAIRDLRR
jgi:hypothetical protein